MANFTLTAGADTLVGGAANDTVYATAATLNAGDSLTGGAGTDVLALLGSGTFHVDQLASFTGFERITLKNYSPSFAQLVLGSQPIEVDATGYLSIQVNSPSNWNGSDIINGDASLPSTPAFMFFSNNQPLPVTYDLTSNTLSHVTVYGSGNVTLLINNADTAGVQSFNDFGQGDKLVTAGSTLDLSHTTVSGFTVASTNGVGTTFTVSDLGTAFQIIGGSGQDTLVAQGLTLTADQRTAIFQTASIETITDQSGTYAAPAAPPVGLTPGNDTFVAPSSGSTVYATAVTLNAGDSLTGGAGTDVLALLGSGTFHVDQLASFTGFERITLKNYSPSFAQLVLGSQPIEVDATGYLSIQVNSPSNWNGSDIINGDASLPSTPAFMFFSNNQPLPVTYDLTSNTLSHVTVYGNSSNVTLLINNADTAGVQSFNDFGQGDKLVTAGSTLDLSHTTVSGFTVASTNGVGTTFTVSDLGTAFQIIGGSGQDTLVAQGLTLTADQRTAIFQTASIETITDQSGTYAADTLNVNEAPTAVALANTTASIAENTSTASHIKVADINVTDDALGSNTLGLTGTDAGFFEIAGNALYLKAGTVLDFESKASYAVAVTVDDPTVGGTPDATSTTYTLNVSNVNEAPTFNNINQQLTNDTGSSHVDRITMDGHVTLSGAVSDANGVSVVEIFDGNTDLGPATLSNGQWTFSTVLGAGNHTLDAVATDAAGNTTTSATQPIIKVDNTGPTITISQHLANDTGISNTDGITRDGHVSLSGTVSDANGVAGIEIYDGTTDLGAATITQIGQWTFSTLLAQGPHALDAVATDVAGNTTTTATQHSILLDTTPPVPVMLDAINNTSNTLTTLGGTSEASSSVSIYDSNKLIGTTTADANGNWNFQAKVTGNPIHSYTETATDLAGNVGSSTGSTIYATSSNKTLLGGTGNDVLVAAPKDTLTGGLGSDTFVFNPSFGKVTVSDFNANIDTLAFDHNLFSNAAQLLSQAHDTSAGVVITVDALDSVTLTGVHMTDLQNHQSAFHFF